MAVFITSSGRSAQGTYRISTRVGREYGIGANVGALDDVGDADGDGVGAAVGFGAVGSGVVGLEVIGVKLGLVDIEGASVGDLLSCLFTLFSTLLLFPTLLFPTLSPLLFPPS